MDKDVREFVCAVHGCDNSVKNGHVLYRVSGYGQDFIGLCEEHVGSDDPIVRDAAKLMEDYNFRIII